VQALNALTGALLWQFSTRGLEVISSPAVVGPVGQEVAAFSDMAGMLHVVRLADGVQLYHYQTGGYVTASVAAANGHLVSVSSDGFLYDFQVGGGNAPPPTTLVTFPASNAQIPNPNGNLTISGTASDAQGVAAVEVAVAYDGPTGVQWYNAATQTATAAAIDNPAALSAPRATSTRWSFTFPAPASGGTYQVFASAVNLAHQADVKGASRTFNILPSTTAPVIQLSNQYAPPGGSFFVSGSGFRAGEVVSVAVDGQVLAQPSTNASGAFPQTSVTLPPTAKFGSSSRLGPTTVVATGQTSQLVTSTFLDITNEWTQGAQGPTRVSFESNDNILHDSLDPGANQFLAACRT